MDATILVVDDEPDYRELLSDELQGQGFTLLFACDGAQALDVLQRQAPDLVLLDILMPRMDGWEACHRIRQISDVPIIMLTCLGRDEDKVRGLELGADDYLAKTASRAELIARIRAVLRRRHYPIVRGDAIHLGDRLTLDCSRRQVIVDGRPVRLSAHELQLLTCLVENAGRLLTHQSLLTHVWGWEYANDVDYLKVYIHHLRQKICPDPRHPRYILTERGLGYRFVIPSASAL